MRVEQIREFLEQPEIKLLIENEDLEAVYAKCDKHERKDLTEYLLSIGIQPDEYMQNIPPYFLRGSQIRSYNISSTVGVIDNSAFRGCSSLTSVTIPDSVITICEGAFYYCTSLTDVIIGDGVQSIGIAAFSDCDRLTNVTIGNGVASIDNSAFYRCQSLTSVTIGNSVKSIAEGAFCLCGELEINYNGTQKQWEAIIKKATAFKDTYYVVHCVDGDIVKRRK